ncbi:MAG: molybdenum cofactor biosynthesis protein [Candidatus Brockarchaeota archaeon]|nr:molybdenum cofactor biosynthesis protein [Candidatus Brockarchaeota archaeon]
MKPFRDLISLEEAIRTILENVSPINRVEEVHLDDAIGRVMAEDVFAPIDVPHFDRAAMDGFAVRAQDTYGASPFNPVKLKLIGSIRPEETPSRGIEKGECIQVSTGCMMPLGSDSVIMYEHTESNKNEVIIYRPVHPWENVSKKGSDIRKGEKVIDVGEVITPAKIGVLAALGFETVRVFGKPNVAVIPTGSELVEIGNPLEGTKIYDVNSHTLISVIKLNGGNPVKFPSIKDNPHEIRAVLFDALVNDLVILTGGSSVGERDVIYDVLSKEGEVLFHGIQVKPGKPTICALVKGKVVLAMPGHPTSCLSNAYLFLIPALRKLARLPKWEPKIVKKKLGRRIVSTLGRRVFLTVKLIGDEAIPVFKESSAITSMAEADGYIVIRENVDTLEKGDIVDVYLFE